MNLLFLALICSSSPQNDGADSSVELSSIIRILAVAAFFAIFLLAYVKVCSWWAYRAMRRKLSMSFSLVHPHHLPRVYVDREGERKMLKEKLVTISMFAKYIVYTGPKAAGKTQLMHEAVEEIAAEGVPGVVFLEADPWEPVAKTIADALGMNSDFILRPDVSTLQRILEGNLSGVFQWPKSRSEALSYLEKALCRNVSFYGMERRLLTIVIDEVSRLLPVGKTPSYSDAEELFQLQLMAKSLADNRAVKMVFVDSSGPALELMLSERDESRMELVIVEDVWDAQSFLIKCLKGTMINPEYAFHHLAGSRLELILHLTKLALNQNLQGHYWSQERVIEAFLCEKGFAPLNAAGLYLPPSPYDEKKVAFMWYILRKLVKVSESQCLWELLEEYFLPSDDVQAIFSQLLEANVICLVGAYTYCLHSQAVKTAITLRGSLPLEI